MTNDFCLAPWFDLYIGEIFIKPCCVWHVETDEYFWSTVDDIEKFWYSEKLQKIRTDYLKGIIPMECENCLNRLKSRKILLDFWLGESYKKERLVAKPPFKPLLVSLQLGNPCNLQCTMCGSWGSSNWVKDDVMLNNLDENFVRKEYGEYKVDVSKFKDSKEMFSDLIRFDFKGGEPMIQNSMIEMIENLITWGNAPNITLAYVTNGLYTNNKIIKLWKYFKQARIILSLDGIGDLFSYIRGYDFKKFEETLYLYDKIENLRGYFNVTTSIYNILDLAEINHWFLTRNCKRFPSLTHGFQHFDNRVVFPPYLDATILPKKFKQLALEKIYKYDHPNILQLAEWLKTIKDIPADEEQLKLFVKFTNFMDKKRGTKFLKIKPEFEEIFKEYS